MKKLIMVGIASVIITSIGILVGDNTFEKKPDETTREASIQNTFNIQKGIEQGEYYNQKEVIEPGKYG